jgi:hypothetical protein
MALDVYHQVLHKLFEVTEGKGSKAVDFKNLVKQLGFTGHYSDILGRLSGEGWIVETPKVDFVCISHWGVAEVKKASSASGSSGDSNAEIKRDANRALATVKELSISLEEFAGGLSKEDFSNVEKKFSELQNLIGQIKKTLA